MKVEGSRGFGWGRAGGRGQGWRGGPSETERRRRCTPTTPPLLLLAQSPPSVVAQKKKKPFCQQRKTRDGSSPSELFLKKCFCLCESQNLFVGYLGKIWERNAIVYCRFYCQVILCPPPFLLVLLLVLNAPFLPSPPFQKERRGGRAGDFLADAVPFLPPSLLL